MAVNVHVLWPVWTHTIPIRMLMSLTIHDNIIYINIFVGDVAKKHETIVEGHKRLHVRIFIYIFIFMYMYMYRYMYVCVCVSLSLFLRVVAVAVAGCGGEGRGGRRQAEPSHS